MTTTRPHPRRRAAGALALTLLVAATTACGDDGDDGAATTHPSAETTSDSTDPDAVAITAVDYGFEDVPAQVQAGAELTLRNRSASEVHELVAMRLPADEGRAADELVQLPDHELGALFGGPPDLVLIAAPGGDAFTAVGDGTLDESGRYLLVCFIPTGAEPSAYLDALEANPGQPPAVPGGPPHLTAGMYAEVTVR